MHAQNVTYLHFFAVLIIVAYIDSIANAVTALVIVVVVIIIIVAVVVIITIAVILGCDAARDYLSSLLGKNGRNTATITSTYHGDNNDYTWIWIMCQTNCQRFSILLLFLKKILFLFKK